MSHMTTAGGALSGFLLARIAEDEARASSVVRNVTLRMSDGYLSASSEPLEARVLAECDAKRQRVEALVRGLEGRQFGTVAAFLLKLDGLPYADHPDYRQEWRP